jgi:1-aminocyclopropane-1-carboxylate deaminase/D-cysteine desulfhydrase-like pyridoxal-dependent ACC family enzyme
VAEADERCSSVIRSLSDRLTRFARAGIAALPTPLDGAPRLAASLGVRRLSVKRDDLTGLALGGNKTRQLDLVLGRAIAHGATALVTVGAVQSNQSRQVAAAGARLGLPVHVVSIGVAPQPPVGNHLMCRAFGATMDVLPSDADPSLIREATTRAVDVFRDRGHKPHVVDLLDYRSEDSRLAAVAYVEAACEIAEQLGGGGMPMALFVSCGTGSSPTLAGLAAGVRALGAVTRVIGVPASPQPQEVVTQTIAIAHSALTMLECDARLEPSDIDIRNEFAGAAYGPSAESLEAVRVAARTEGLLLEPLYTGKAFAAMLAYARSAEQPDATLGFVHTGGAPLFFLPEVQERLGAD